jgi:hypothetical protein
VAKEKIKMKTLVLLLITAISIQANAGLMALNCETETGDEAKYAVALTFTEKMDEGTISVASNSSIVSYNLNKVKKNVYEAATGMGLIHVEISNPRKDDGYTEYDMSMTLEGEDEPTETYKYICTWVDWNGEG